MKRLFLFVVLLSFYQLGIAQKLNQSAWQQHVAYTISVSLNDSDNTLKANIQMVYTNNSPNTLTQIYMHLWPNAYSSRNTAFAKQHLENGKTDFYFAKTEERGNIDSLNFLVDNQKIDWQYTKDIDIALLNLKEPLKPNASITISTPFYVKLPKVYSRLGHENQLYCITQWYPKPAVYDVNGWNPMPYLDQGEFYSEFGSFDVSITIPKNYVVAATGNLQNEEERQFLNGLAEGSIRTFDEIPLTSKDSKTLRYIQDSVHDFAWFASKEFNVRKDEVLLSNGKKVATWYFAKQINGQGTQYTNEGVKYYSDHIGNYPYNIAQVVITPLKAGGGMEYPTITNCGSTDRTTIIHEVGHNWFYGILGSNERAYPWMDESLNTYYESRCTQEKNDSVKLKYPQSQNMLKDVFNLDAEGFGQARFLYSIAARQNEDQAGNLPSTVYTDFNYGAIIYAKNPLSFYMLQNYLGNEKMDAMMKAYYEKWKFKHPLPDDFRNHAETFAKENLSWFFDDVLGSTKKMDYKITKVGNNEITIENKSGLNVPFSLTSLNADKQPIRTKHYEGFIGRKKLDLVPLLAKDSLMKDLVIDQNQSSIELYRQNNSFHKPLSIRFIPALENPKKHQIFCIPLYGWNNYNKSMLGLFINNDFFPNQKTEFNFTPLYSFTTSDWNGYFGLAKNISISSPFIKSIKLGINAARFASKGLVGNQFGGITYEKLAPRVEINFKQAEARSLFENKLIMRHITILENIRHEGYFNKWNNTSMSAFDATHIVKHNLATYPTQLKANLQIGTAAYNYSRLTVEINQGIAYSTGKKKVNIRLFGGTFLNQQTTTETDLNQSRTYFQLGGTNGFNDYFYDEAMLGRAERTQQDFWLARQVINRDAGFRNFASLGNSKSWITAANFTIPFPFKLPIGFYTDCSYGETFSFAPQTGLYSYETVFSSVGGVYISIAKNVFEIYLPVFASKNVEESWALSGGFNHPFERASFILNLNALSPTKLVKSALK